MSDPQTRSIGERLQRIVLTGSRLAQLRDEPKVVPFTGRGVAEAPLPDRYEIRDTVDDYQILRCKEAPGIAVRLDRGFAFSETEARRLGPRTILLDGAARFGPTLDDGRHLYNLDHHADCLRAFTLATCEQALLLVHKGIELDRDDWTLYANEPDLDTVLAIWVLLNHRRVRNLSAAQRDVLLPLLRLEGAIDANGYELAQVCGLPSDSLAASRARIDRLYADEQEVKTAGQWTSMDMAAYTLERLRQIDALVYSAEDLRDFTSVEEEYGHVAIGQQKVAVVCRDGRGIYDVEGRLKKVWGERLGIVALEKAPGHFTLRRAAALAGIDLQLAYDRLNLLDRTVDGRPPEKRWGGSDEIGGSPRPDGTALTPSEISEVLGLAYRTSGLGSRLGSLVTTLLWAASLGAIGALTAFLSRRGAAAAGLPEAPLELATFLLLAGLFAAFLTLRSLPGRAYLFGWRRPAAPGRWLLLVPLAGLAAAACGGVWLPAAASGSPPGSEVLILLTAALALELWFRGLLHGRLLFDAPVQHPGGPWILSWPNVFSALCYAVLVGLAQPWLTTPLFAAEPAWLLPAAGGLLFGLIQGALRERSLSLWPGILSHGLAALWLLAWRFLAG